ncbi:Protein kinase domain-containing protein [Mycena venus]|uniref:Protein kinase domain-containing protein n=1 Tax=Mycena venus TaxID=2733690 RepID=A0A8H6YEU8_9AGAR|nr:Protein kinase domain-containing protein [Mycena venus]
MPASVVQLLDAYGVKSNQPHELSEVETYWRDHHDWLKASGYELRPRFRPGWEPSWKADPRKTSFTSEDAWRLTNGAVIDAVRVSDNTNVVLKRINKDQDHHPHEVEIGNFLTALGPTSANHCVPTLDTLHPPDDENISIIVMPLLRKYDSPRFDTVGEAVEFFRQIFEGLQFMHHHHVAHRDCNSNNIMMDGQHLYPQGFHPERWHQDLKPNAKSNAPYYTRTRFPVKYYFIDFGLSRRYDPARGPPSEDIILGGDKSPPEHAPGNLVCDPFPTDIYFLGNLIRRDFLDGYPEIFRYGNLGFEFMRPLVDDMVQADPTKRPTIDQVVARFAEIQKGLSSWTLRSRVIGQREFVYLPQRIIGHWYRRIRSIVMRVPAVPVPSS